MQEGSFIWIRLKKQHRAVNKWVDRLWLIVLLLAAVLLFSINLGGLPLQDFDEGTVAQVAREIWRNPTDSLRWLYPTLGGEPYHKPPLLHWLIAWAYSLGGVNEWTTRLPGAILTATSVPLLYCIGREIFWQRWAAVYSALIYLTMLPVVRYGRLAILDGTVVSLLLIMMLCLLRSRRDLRYCLGVGVGFGLISLTKGIEGIFLGVIPVLFLFWDTPRLLTYYYFWVAILLGSLPVIGWYVAQLMEYGYPFSQVVSTNPYFYRLSSVIGGKSEPLWYYLGEILKFTWPWLVFLPQTLRLTKENSNLSWAKLIIVWVGVYVLLVSLMSNKLPGYILPIYPGLALAFGFQLAEAENLSLFVNYPRGWVRSFAVLAVVAAAGSIYFCWNSAGQTDLQMIFAAAALTMSLTAILAERNDKQLFQILIWGSYLSLLLLMRSNYWVWELQEAYPVKPVAAMIVKANPPVRQIYTSFSYHRPSLDFYSDRTIIPITGGELKYHWQDSAQPYFLVNSSELEKLQFPSVQVLGQAEGWQLITKKAIASARRQEAGGKKVD
ncbi:MAG TPA: glycosyltransferase family 39 protein [Nostocaceae cyanobacterium]|nr:glycosyltransferase family 39 protein [Nostocaceae cyanobacterium]